MTPSRRDVLRSIAGASIGFCISPLAPKAIAQGGGDGSHMLIRRPIPKSGELIPAVGLGTSRTFDVDPDGDLSTLSEVMRHFLDAGGTVIDSSPMYGRSEEVIGRLLDIDGRDGVFYATKVWTDEGRDAGIEQMRTSMRLMGADVMDLMQIHNLVDWQTHLPTLREWKDEGTIRYIGITEMRDFATVERIMRDEDIDFIQIPYSINDRRVEERVLPAAAETGTAVLVMRPFGRGRLFEAVAGKELPGWAAEINCDSWAQVFLKFLLGHPAVTCPIPATSKPHHMVDNMGGGVGPVPDEALRTQMVSDLGF